MKQQDFLKDTGYLAIASRLKRMTEQLFRGGGRVYKALQIEFEPQWFTLFYYLYNEGSPQSIVAASEALHVSHPAVIQTAKALVKAGLISSRQDQGDRRKRWLNLTDKGHAMAQTLLPVWDSFTVSVTNFMEEIDVDLLENIARIEASMAKEDLQSRILRHIKAKQYQAVEIVDYKPSYGGAFRMLNEEWLKKDFSVEEADTRMLKHAQQEIINPGGTILFARLGGKVVGTVALLKRSATTYELAKMAVTEAERGKQVGRRLADAAIGWARKQHVKTLELWTDPKQKAAVNLYKTLGFKITGKPRHAVFTYERQKTGFMMTLDLTAKAARH